jgi:hypothetical protein
VHDPHLQGVVRTLGLDLEHAFVRGEKNVGEDGLGCDGQIVEPPPAEPGHGTGPGDKVASLPDAREIRRHLFLLRLHIIRLHRRPTGAAFV